MITRMIIVTVPVEKIAEAERLWKQECAPLMIQQEGCVSEELLRNRDNKGELISVQQWESQDAIDKYRSSPAHQEILKHTRGLMGVSKVEVKNYEVVS
ncbi:MAG: antibiotic biosynthesis monooxygenase [Acidobacteria bacterium]|nr:antibiotic biosynthesis monooxygenase [Acidobacteriota bacterium]